MMNNELHALLLKIDERLTRIEQSLEYAKLSKESRIIWTEQQIADYLGLSKRYVSVKIVTLEDFPKPIDYGNTAEHKKHRRYISGEIIAYFEEMERAKQTKRIIKRRTQQDIEQLVVQARRNAIKAMRGISQF